MLQLGNDENVKQLLLKMPKFYHYLINNCKKIVHVFANFNRLLTLYKCCYYFVCSLIASAGLHFFFSCSVREM